MKRILLLLFVFMTGLYSFSQVITANNTLYTVPQLVQNVLFAPSSGSASCIGTITNITWSTGTNFGSTNGIGYFTNTNPNFPLTSGVILSTGNALSAPGAIPGGNNSTQSNGINAWTGDLDLFNYMSNLGIIDPNLDEYDNATILEFDFVPLTNQMSFDFLFASEEYGQFQCQYSDAFAFFLTNVTAGTAPINLAVVPSTTTPISVTTIRDDAGQPDCSASNIAYFGSNNQGGTAASDSATNFNGQTVVITASSPVIPNNTYHIKLVIADLNDNQYDSAVFLGGGSFNIGTPDISGTGPYINSTDFTVANSTAVCGSTVLVIQAGAVAIPGATYAWTLGTTSVGTNSNLLTVTQAGTYGVNITYPGGCQQSDTITVEYYPQSITLGTPSNLIQCSGPFNLTQNTAAILNGIPNTVSYHHTLAQAQQQSGAINNPTTYNGTNGEIIYAAVEDFGSGGCILTTQFTLNIDLSLCVVPPVAVIPPDLYQYETTFGVGTAIFNLTSQTPIIYGSNLASAYTVTYYSSMPNAMAGTNAITGINAFQNSSNPQRIFAVLSDNADTTNFTIVSFLLNVVALPNVSITGPAAVCNGSTATITFTGTPNATVNYTENGNARQIVLNASGTATYVSSPLLFNTTFNLVTITATSSAGAITQPVVGSVTVTINYPPTINTPVDYVVCDDSLDNDGIYCNFDFNTKINEITGGSPIIVDFYETATSGSPILLSVPYCNLISGDQEIFVRAYDSATPNCFSTTSFHLIINTIPLPNPSITDYPLCDNNNQGDGIEVFNLGTKTTEIANGQLNVTVTYYDSLVNAQGQISPLPNLYSSGSRPIWINIRNTTTGCNTTGTFNLVVNPLPLPVIPPPIFECSNGLVLTATFDLTINEAITTAGQTGRVVSYYTTLTAAQNGTPILPSPTTYFGFDTEVVFVRVQNTNTGCFTITTQLLRVTQGPLAVTPQPLEICDPNRDGFGSFDLASALLEIQGGTIDPNVTVTFHETQVDATLGGNALATTYTNINPYLQTIYVRVFYTLSGCANYVTLNLIVHDNPLATVPTDYLLCNTTAGSNTE
ncbi:choice-of-anchor L domain-containing protein, partial [Flavobacterium sp.]|uniref:choice-of-anchor L domain-containing protein n=1 Tax=Flavobacterium sp. TaxID=239 RepID=UPI002487D211